MATSLLKKRPYAPQDAVKISMWLRDKATLQAEAKAEGRSLSGYINHLLSTHPDRKPPKRK